MIDLLQRLLRRIFMAVEGVFNRAFGDRFNPLYHLGATAFFLFWVVAVSGTYLYAFFDTAVAAAYPSVEAITHRQWFAGGLLRSVHRYASDAMVVIMLLHMLRWFAFDRLRGFRWFSWVSGVGLIWLVYIVGINGYMLPWDRYAQFVTVQAFEWMSALPLFGATIMRNFVYPASMTDRFFSLLAFIHIGVSLIILLMMWVHVQRVPKAATQPPRPIALSLLATLAAMAILLPVMSQGGMADLMRAVDVVHMDWFFLPVLPLIARTSPETAWWVVGLGTALLLALPWLRRAGKASAQQEFQLAFHPGVVHVSARPGETLLDAGLRAGLALPYDCRNGGCGVCECSVLNGRVDHGAYQPAVLTDAMRAAGKALMCVATPLEDVELEVAVDSLQAGAGAAADVHVARVERMERLGDDVIRMHLLLPGGERLPFAAGQYINILLEDGQKRAFSFANPPHDNAMIELHVRRVPGGRFTTRVFETMQVGDEIRFEGPVGRFTLHASQRPIVFIAGATGFAPIKSIVEDALHRRVQRPMWLYWGVRRKQDLYLLALAEAWAREHAHFQFVPVLSEPDLSDAWTGRTGFVHEALLADFPDLRGHEVYVCGSVRMVENAVPAMLAQGLDENACFSDAFVPGFRPGSEAPNADVPTTSALAADAIPPNEKGERP
ncbi:MAG TPA: 2Fe-2S iron-sulfur cluster-binding protein [Patescibacteria group bacterium]|nr:2Fe-2S iron-sulfur cluster-binding protein [Patescibacteria group bacterium]